MSELTTAARPYAKAVFELASEDKTQTQWSEALSALDVIVSDENLSKALDNPNIAHTDVASLVIDVAGKALDKKSSNLVKLLAENGRLAVIPALRQIFEALCSESEGSIDATVVSAMELSKEQISNLSSSLTRKLGREVKLECSVDESLLGGVIVKAGDLVIDGSLKGRLTKMTSALGR